MIHFFTKHTIITLICLVYTVSSWSQNMTIKSVALQPSDKTAIIQPRFDNNGDTCALLKIKTDNLEGLEFPNRNQYIKVSYQDGIYNVYLPYNVGRRLDFLHKDYMPVHLDMADYGYRKLRKGKTYLVVLDAQKKTDLKSSIIFKIVPQNAVVTFNKKKLELSENGTYEIPVSAGTYSYMISAKNYQKKEGTISIVKNEVKTSSIRLIPITHEVIVGSNVEKAHVFIDNIDYGPIGKIIIPQGEHDIRVQAEGYIDSQKHVSVNESTYSLSFILNENKRVTHIHATPVTIYSSSSKIYKNNKQIKGWSNGAVIRFMPGKYILSDENGSTKKIVVGYEPMTVILNENKRVTHIHETPVTIYSSSSKVYKNNKQIKGWSNGAVIRFMPGEYLLSDDNGSTKKIVVGYEPMTVILNKNKRVTQIHATPVTIYSSSSKVYNNNKQIKGWSNGAVIRFMPGIYLLSGDNGSTKKIVVGYEPMTVRL